MKDKVLIFIIGLLVGAIITVSAFVIYEKNNKNTNQIQRGEEIQKMERPNGETPPEKPDGTEDESNRPEVPSKRSSFSDNKTN